MARFRQPEAKKGSQKWVQKLVNDKPHIMNSRIWGALNLSTEEGIQWFSPLKSDDYAEYRDQAFLDRLGIKLEKVSLKLFGLVEGLSGTLLARALLGNCSWLKRNRTSAN